VKRYSKKVREEAARVASMLACTLPGGADVDVLDCVLSPASTGAQALFWCAWHQARRSMPERWSRNAYDPILDAEAEALIRTGWSPD
jgi:hypothetical protein